VLLLAGAGWEQVQITLTPDEARRIAQDLLATAGTVERRLMTEPSSFKKSSELQKSTKMA